VSRMLCNACAASTRCAGVSGDIDVSDDCPLTDASDHKHSCQLKRVLPD
jgi:hypothetical protein